jgi:hypothetical protein
MKDMLERHLTPDDDGRAFTDAVLLRASGALHRRRAAAAQSQGGTLWTLLERWGRPWVIAMLIGIAVAAAVPVLPAVRGTGEMSLGSDALLASTAPDADLGFSIGN